MFLNRRDFLAIIPCVLLAACAKNSSQQQENDVNKEFHLWLKKKKRYRDFNTLDEAKKAYEDEITRKDKEAEWKEYRKKHKLR